MNNEPLSPKLSFSFSKKTTSQSTLFLTSLLTHHKDVSLVNLCITLEEGCVLEIINDIFEKRQPSNQETHVISFTLKKKSRLIYKHIITNIENQRFSYNKNLSVTFLDADAQATITMRYIMHSKQQAVISTTQHHQSGNSQSNLSLRTALFDQTKLYNTSNIIVKKNCNHVTAHQANKNLLLGSQAFVKTKPEIDIHAHHVTCTHGATISNIDPEHVWYLKSRGVDEEMAKTLIMNGFLGL